MDGSLPHSQEPDTISYLSHIDPVHAPTSHVLMIYFNIILPSTPGSSKWSLSLRFLHQNPVYTCARPHTCYMPRPPHYFRLDQPKDIGWGVQIISFSLCSFSPLLVTSSLLGLNILLGNLFWNILSLCSSLSVRDQVSHASKKQAKL